MYEFAKKKGDNLEMNLALSDIGGAYKESGDYERAFFYFKQVYEFELQTRDQKMLSLSLFALGELYMNLEDYSLALSYYRNAFQKDNLQTQKIRLSSGWDIWVKMEFAEIFSHLNQFDSAWHYYKLFKPAGALKVYDRIYLVSTGECYFLQNDYNKALENFLLALPEHRKSNDRNQVMRALLDIAKTYLELGNDSAALNYGKEGLAID